VKNELRQKDWEHGSSGVQALSSIPNTVKGEKIERHHQQSKRLTHGAGENLYKSFLREGTDIQNL
jgi:hypothetical protein